MNWAAGLGDVYKDLGEFTASMKFYNKVIEVNKEVDDKAIDAKIHKSLGDISLLEGVYEDALFK
ncbi:MAG: tetratricopeptide repeat protein [Ignavibacteria bacterium]